MNLPWHRRDRSADFKTETLLQLLAVKLRAFTDFCGEEPGIDGALVFISGDSQRLKHIVKMCLPRPSTTHTHRFRVKVAWHTTLVTKNCLEPLLL